MTSSVSSSHRPPGPARTVRTSPAAPSGGDVARALQSSGDRLERLQRGVDLAVELVQGCDHASVTVVSAGSLATPVASDDLVQRGDARQYELREGPCVDTVRQQHTVLARDLATDARWPRWAPWAVDELGARAVTSLLLWTATHTYGALNLYADRADVFDDDQVALAESLAGQLAVALADATEIHHRGQAMNNRTVIGQAEGILMERLDLDPDAAFAYLRRVSQNSHRKLVDVARDLVATRQLPEASGAGAAVPPAEG